MTESTGARARQRRREELFSAEMKLRRVLLHLMSAIAWACYHGLESERRASSDAYDFVRRCYGDIASEQKELTTDHWPLENAVSRSCGGWRADCWLLAMNYWLFLRRRETVAAAHGRTA